jgi:hypothetical protein
MARKRIGEILIEAGVLDESGLRAALIEQRRWGGQLGRILVEMNLVSEAVLVKALSHQLNFPMVELVKQQFDPSILELVPGELAEQHSIVPFRVEGKFLDVAMSDPTNLGIIDELRIRTQLNVRPYIAGPRAIEKALAKFYGRGLAYVSRSPSMYGREDFQSGAGDLELETSGAVAGASSPKPAAGAASESSRDPGTAAQRRAAAFALGGLHGTDERGAEIRALQERISKLEALLARDEDVLRKVLGLLVEKGVASREEVLERIK